MVSDPTFWKVALALVAPVCGYLALRSWRLARVIDDTPASRIRSAAQGYVEIGGRARLPPPATNPAPLSGRTCCWWSYRIERRQSSGRNSEWETIEHRVSEVPFVLEDETGSCQVHPQGADVRPKDRSVWYGSESWPSTRPNAPQTIFARLSGYRYTENRIPELETVHVIGDFRTVGGATAADTTGEVMHLLDDWKRDQPALLERFDVNRDGVLSMEEWEAARSAARAQIEQTPAAAPAPTANVIMQPQDARPFLLAAYDLEQIARRSRWVAAGLVVACVAAVGTLAHLLFDGG